MSSTETYEYNGLNWRTRRNIEKGTSTWIQDQDRLMYYSANWQLLEERIDDDDDANPGIDRHVQYVWGPRYIDDIILHREDGDLDGNYLGANDNYWFHCTDVQFSTVAILDENAQVAERITYDAYGQTRHHHFGDLDGDGDSDTADGVIRDANWGLFGPGDLNRDGTVNVTDLLMLNGDWGAALPWGELSHRTPGNPSHPDNTVGWDGYLHSGIIFLYYGCDGLFKLFWPCTNRRQKPPIRALS